MHAVGRIAYRGWIDNVQVSWVKTGVAGARQALQAGCNDLGGTLMDENISRAAGASHGQELDESEFRAIVEPLGRPLEQRTTLYGRTHDRRPPPAPAARGASRPIGVAVPRRPSRSGGARCSLRPRALVSRMRDRDRLDVVAIGNALVDVLSHETDEFVAEHGLEPGAMDAHRHRAGRDALRGDGSRQSRSRADRPPTRWSGSRRSAARAAFIGRVADDELGERLRATTSAPPACEFDAPARGRRRSRPAAASSSSRPTRSAR